MRKKIKLAILALFTVLTSSSYAESSDRVLFFPGSFSPPHRAHFELLKTALRTYPRSEVVVIFNNQIRDQIDPEIAREIWSHYYFRVLSEEFPNSQFLVESAHDQDPHFAAIWKFKKDSRYKNAIIIAGEDRKEYSRKLDEPKWRSVLAPLEKEGRFISYWVTQRDQEAPDAISATRLRECLRGSIRGNEVDQGLLRECRRFFPTELSDSLFLEAASWVANRMMMNMSAKESGALRDFR